jgi:alkanesulfonate monooxygenase SsuD/methylene tetrahydromethanopterin reductase-like flavin-dependent oxidoreductase (luciferase family)
MRIGIGLPNPVPGARGRVLVEWAARAEEAGFSTLATIDRVVYPSYESLVSLAAAAGATRRITLMTNVLLAPTRNAVLLAKEAASVDRLSESRLLLGLAPGARKDDFDATEQEFASRGARFDEALRTMHELWAGRHLSKSEQPSVPSPGAPVKVLIGGMTERAIERTVRWGLGWTAGGAGPDAAGDFGTRVRAAWRAAGREGDPLVVALSYYGLGPAAEHGVARYLRDYYAYVGGWVDRIVEGVPRTGDEIKQLVARFEDAGVDELMLDPTIAELDQVDRLAEVVL